MNLDDLKNFDFNQMVEDLQELDPENIGNWPLPIKVVIFVLVFTLVIFGGYQFQIKEMNRQLADAQNQEGVHMKEFEDKSFQALNLDRYRLQLAEMEASLEALLKQLPSDTEVPGLLEDITHTGLGSGLEFNNISLGEETVREFYAELPISIMVHGDYHGFGAFVSGVAALPRIVTLHDYSIDRAESGLTMKITAKTYRYNDKGDK